MKRSLSLLCPLLLAGCGTDVSGPGASLFSCLLAAPTALEAGEVVQVGGAGNRGLCLDGADGAAEFVYIPFHAADAARDPVDLRVTGLGVVPSGGNGVAASGAVVALRGAPAPVRRPADDPVHRWLRSQERGELAALLGSGRSDPLPLTAADVPEVGDLVEYNTGTSCSVADPRTGRVEYVSEHAIVVADIENPAGLTAADYRHFALTFDTLVHPVDVAHFGEPTDVDGNDRAILFYTRAVNELSGPSSSVYTAGFFWSGDLFPEEDTPRASACPAANQAEIFYMLAADPTGVAGPPFSAEFIRQTTVGVLAHEYQHLINAGRRLWVNEASEFEETWLNEGLSHAAEELVFYAASGLTPGANLDFGILSSTPGAVAAFNAYMSGNLTNYGDYLQRPDTASLMGIDVLPTRGAAWNFLRYAADRSGLGDEAFFQAIVNGRIGGLENLREALDIDPLEWMQDWTVSVFADDEVPTQPRFLQPSWNLRSLFGASTLGRFPLAVLPLEDGTGREIRLRPGGAAFPRFGVPGHEGVLDVEAAGGAPPARLRGSFLRIR